MAEKYIKIDRAQYDTLIAKEGLEVVFVENLTVNLKTTPGPILTVNPVPVAGGTGYAIGDILTLTTTGTGGTCRVLTLGASNAVATVELVAAGDNYTTGTKSTSVSPPGGSGCTISVVSLNMAQLLYTAPDDGYNRFITRIILRDPSALASAVAGGFGTAPTSYTGSILVLNPVPTAGGTGYTVGDILTITTGGLGGTCRVLTLGASDAVATVELVTPGYGYAATTGRATSGGTGSGCTVAITTLADWNTFTALSGWVGAGHYFTVLYPTTTGRSLMIAPGGTFGMRLSAGNTGSISTMNPTPTAGGSGYHVGDILTITTTGSGATCRVLTLSGSAVATFELLTAGSGYTVGTGRATSVMPAGGTGCTLAITAITSVTAKADIYGFLVPAA